MKCAAMKSYDSSIMPTNADVILLTPMQSEDIEYSQQNSYQMMGHEQVYKHALKLKPL